MSLESFSVLCLFNICLLFQSLCLLLGLLPACGRFHSAPSATGPSCAEPSHQGFSSLLCNCGFVDWGLTSPSKGRLLRSGILCRATVYESAMSPTSCYQVTGMAIARDDLDRHTRVYRVTVQILEKEQRWTPRQVLQRVKWTRLATAISPNQHFCKCGRENLQRSLRSKLCL